MFFVYSDLELLRIALRSIVGEERLSIDDNSD